MAEPEINLDFLDAGIDMHALDDISHTDAPTVLDRLGPAHFRSKGFSFMGFLQTVYDHVAEQSKRAGPPVREVIDESPAEEPAASDSDTSDADAAEPESREPSLIEALPAAQGLFGATSIEAAGIGAVNETADSQPGPTDDPVTILSDRLEAENAAQAELAVDTDRVDDEEAPTHIAANASDIVEVNAADSDDGSDIIDANIEPDTEESPRKAEDV